MVHFVNCSVVFHLQCLFSFNNYVDLKIDTFSHLMLSNRLANILGKGC